MAEFTLGQAPLRERTLAALAQPSLRRNLRRATDRFMRARAAAFSQLADPDGLRAVARALRARTVARLPELLERFADRLLALGAHVHWAEDADSACRYIGEVAARHGVRKVVKSKSMASEEIGLNRYLEGLGMQVVETDLGEWIVQLAGETPSHVLAPAIHKDRRQIAALFGQLEGSPVPEEPAKLAAFARARLRDEFLSADMGISGVNFGVAATGTLVLVTNEGNGRMVTSLPRVHVALMGTERLVADLAELDVLLALLSRSATGQALSAYTSLITGPRRAAENDGPEELHVVILDNGRSALLGTEFQEALHCIRCGACLNVCPVYRQIGGHAYGWVYSGPIGAVLSPLLLSSPAAQELPNASSLCGACWQACPVGIPLHDLLLRLRRRRPPGNALERLTWRAWALLWGSPHLYRWSLNLLHAWAPLARWPVLSRLPLVSRWARGRALPPVPRYGFRDWWRENR